MTPLRLLLHLMTILMLSSGALAKATPPEDPCPAMSKSREWSGTCFDTTKAGRRIKEQYRKKLVFDRKGFAAIVITTPPELVAVNRSGMVVKLDEAHLSGSDFSFEAGDADGDVVRFGYRVTSGDRANRFKCGYYRTGRFQVLVAPVYDECDVFGEGSALVCIGCTNHCEGGDCHQTDFIGGEGLVINEENEVLRRFPLPTLPLCSASKKSQKKSGDQNCRPRPFDPFSEL
jgi:hypothetical protein